MLPEMLDILAFRADMEAMDAFSILNPVRRC